MKKETFVTLSLKKKMLLLKLSAFIEIKQGEEGRGGGAGRAEGVGSPTVTAAINVPRGRLLPFNRVVVLDTPPLPPSIPSPGPPIILYCNPQ